jgi:hypothetical protein
MLRKTMIVLAAAAALTAGLSAESFARGGGAQMGGGFVGVHVGGGFGPGHFVPDRIPSVSPHFNSFTPYTMPESRESPVSPASPGSVFGSSPD